MRLLLVCGNTQVGKSSFINTVSGCEKANVGIGGQSTTRDILCHQIGPSKLFYETDPSTSELYMIDIPGFLDSDMAISDERIFIMICEKLFELNRDHLDGIIVVESANSSSISIMPTIHRLMQMFGANINSSLIILTTKWDKLDEEEIEARTASYNKLQNLILIKWINDTRNKKINEDTKKLQFRELSAALKKTSLFKLSRIRDLENLCKKRAKKIQSDLPETDRYNISKGTNTITKLIKKTIKVPYDDYEDAYPDSASLNARAEQLRLEAGTYQKQQSTTVQKTELEYYTDIEVSYETHYHQTTGRFLFFSWTNNHPYQVRIEKPVIKSRDVIRNVVEYYTTDEYYDISTFLQKAKEEKRKVTKYKEIIVDDFEIINKEGIIKTEKYGFGYYMDLAKKQMVEEFRALCRGTQA